MAYNVYVACDKCGCGEELVWTNVTVSISHAERIAKKRGWKASKSTGWICPDCVLKEKTKGNLD